MISGRASAGALRARISKSWWVLLAVAAAGIAISTGVLFLARNLEEARVRSVLNLRAEWRASDFDHKLALAVNDLGALAALMTAQAPVDAATFGRFAELVHGPTDSYSSLLWAPLVTADDRASFVAAARQNIAPDYEIIERQPDGQSAPATGRAEFLPILYAVAFEPRPLNRGINVATRAVRSVLIDSARDEGKPIATPAAVIPSAIDQSLGFIVYWPTYATGDVPVTVAERRSAFRGVVMGVFSFAHLFPGAIAGTPDLVESIDFSVDSGVAGEPPISVAHYDPVARSFIIGAPPPPVEAGSYSFQREFSVLGRQWTLISHFSPAFIASLRSAAPWTWFAIGLLLTTLLMMVAEHERWRRSAAETLVEEHTASLGNANRALSEQVGERRAAEERADQSQALVRASFETSPFAIVVRDMEFKILLWNRAAEQIFGYSAEEVLGKNPRFLPDRGGDAHFEALAQRMSSGEVLRGIDLDRRRKDGASVQVRFSGAPLYVDKKFVAYVTTMEDVTERNGTARQLVQSQKMEAIGNLTGGMAHDFNNLLGVIIGNLDLLEPLLRSNPDAAELSSTALDAALHGADLTRRLLAFARRQPLQPLSVDPNELVSATLKLLGRVLDANIELKRELAPGIWPVSVDPVQLEASIVNLATNARDAMPRGGRLTLATSNRLLDADYCAEHHYVTPGEYAMIEVSDSGTGMSGETLSHIFEPFFTTKEQGKGTGLGLSMVFGFIKQSGGHINAYSELGVGTTFRLYLPRNEGAPTRMEAAAEVPIGGGETVLVVEDNAGLRRVALRQLAELGYRGLEAENSDKAIALLESERIDLLFTDIVMSGGLDGFELARLAVKTWPPLKVVLTSGFPEAKTNGKLGLYALSARLLIKPYRKDELARILRAALDAGGDEGGGV